MIGGDIPPPHNFYASRLGDCPSAAGKGTRPFRSGGGSGGGLHGGAFTTYWNVRASSPVAVPPLDVVEYAGLPIGFYLNFIGRFALASVAVMAVAPAVIVRLVSNLVLLICKYATLIVRLLDSCPCPQECTLGARDGCRHSSIPHSGTMPSRTHHVHIYHDHWLPDLPSIMPAVLSTTCPPDYPTLTT